MRPMKYEEFLEEILERSERVWHWNAIAENWNPEHILKQYSFVKEEADEYGTANGKAKIIKELADCLVVQGYFVALCEAFNPNLLEKAIDLHKKVIEDAFLLQRMGFNIFLAFDMVIESNYSKFDNYREDQLDKYDEHCKYLEKDGRYSNVKWEQVVDHVVYRSGEGKLLKGRNYQEPDLSWLEAA